MNKKRRNYFIASVVTLIVLGSATFLWFKFYGYKYALNSPDAKNLIYSYVSKAGPTDGDVTITSYEATRNALALHLNGTVVDDGDLLSAPWLVAWTILPVVFHKTTAEEVTLYWKDYLIVTYDRDTYHSRRQFLLAYYGDVQQQCIWFLRDAKSYKWTNEEVWKRATGEDGWFTKKEIPLSKGY